MSQFINSIFQSFLPPALLLALLYSRKKPLLAFNLCIITAAIAILGGVLIAEWLTMGANSYLFLAAFVVVGLALYIVNYLVPSLASIGYMALAILFFSYGWLWDWQNSTLVISTTRVIDSELIANIGAILAAFVLVFLLAWILTYLLTKAKKLTHILMLFTAVFCLYPLSGELVLGITKHTNLELSAPLLSYIAKATYFPIYLPYLSLAVFAVAMVYYGIDLIKQPSPSTSTNLSSAELRKKAATFRRQRRLFLNACTVFATAGLAQAYWTFIGSKPMALSKATQLFADADGVIRIAVDKVKDGRLHRFMWVASDGHLIRFFVINKKPEQLDLITLFDACMLCGDKGYIMQGDQLFCSACNVKLFIPTLGTSGGCNPLLLEEGGWQYDHQTLTIKTTALANGAQYFSTVVTIKVTDPVDGSKLTNDSAEYNYVVDDTTYFFNNKENYDKFRANPANYLK